MPIIVDKNADDNIIEFLTLKYPDREILKSFELKSLDYPINTHPDIQIHFLNKNLAIVAPECFDYYKSHFDEKNINLIKGSVSPQNTYPSDIAYNVARVGNFVISNTLYTEPKIIEYYQSHGFKILNTKQGYTKCNICIASDNVVITEDPHIYSLLCEIKDIDVLFTESGNVELDTFPYGFIGGASGLVYDTLIFSGKLSDNSIIEFLREREIKFIEATKGQLKDVGSIIYRR